MKHPLGNLDSLVATVINFVVVMVLFGVGGIIGGIILIKVVTMLEKRYRTLEQPNHRQIFISWLGRAVGGGEAKT